MIKRTKRLFLASLIGLILSIAGNQYLGEDIYQFIARVFIAGVAYFGLAYLYFKTNSYEP